MSSDKLPLEQPERDNTSETNSDLEKALAYHRDKEIYGDAPTCPYCDYKDTESGDWHFKMDETEEETTCSNCGKDYFVVGEISYTFTSQKLSAPDVSGEINLKALYTIRKELEEGL